MTSTFVPCAVIVRASFVTDKAVATNGLGSFGWRRLFTHLAETRRAESGQCPRVLRAYAVQIWPRRDGFDADLREGRRFLQRAELKTSASACEVVKLSGASE